MVEVLASCGLVRSLACLAMCEPGVLVSLDRSLCVQVYLSCCAISCPLDISCLMSEEEASRSENNLGRAQAGMRRSQSEASDQCACISSSDATSERRGERSLDSKEDIRREHWNLH